MMKVIPNGRLLDILPGTVIQVSFETPSGKKITLDCEVRWVRHSPHMPFGLKHHVGMEIKNPTHEYREFVHGLYSIHRATTLTGSA